MTTRGPGVAVAVGLAAVLEWAVGEPPEAVHPVALFGRGVGTVADREYGNPVVAGAAVALALPLAAALAVYAPLRAAEARSRTLAAIMAGAVLWVCSSLRLLLATAETVVEQSESDLAAARAALPALVGREPDELSAGLVRSAAVESLAENLSDGLVAPLAAFGLLAVVSLPAAAGGAAFVKAVNTLDSMLGYPGAFGRASARLDDLVMLVPSRVTAVLLGAAAGTPLAPWRARKLACRPASPNAGWPMGTLAAALGVRLEKPGGYVLDGSRGLDDGGDDFDSEADDLDTEDGGLHSEGHGLESESRYPTVVGSRRALVVTRRAGVAAYALVALLGVALWR